MKRSERFHSGRLPVLVVDDEPDIRELLELTLLKMGLEVTTAGTLEEAKGQLGRGRFQLCLTDMRLPDGEGLELVRLIASAGGDLPVAVITAHGSTENAVAALKAGAFDYVSKPIGLEQLRALVRSALSLPDRLVAPSHGLELLGQCEPIRQVRERISRLARTQAPVHISGESGSGKELAARLIHDNGARRDKPFVPVNCGAIPDTLVESEFFGYRKGAFTGANEDRGGFFQAANGGTLFLDEIAELPLAMQVKLLRAIQEKRVRMVGAPGENQVDVRIISATHKNLSSLVAKGEFRQDLFYRLNVIDLRMPSLRECREDIPLIAARITKRLVSQSPGGMIELTPEALDRLKRYDFPGNFRELENILERAIALRGSDRISVGDLSLEPLAVESGSLEPLPNYLDSLERRAILDALAKTGFNRTAAAKLLGITFRQLRYRMQRLEIREPESPAAPI